MAVFTFKHSFVGKANSAAGTAAAHVNYISRPAATCYQEAYGVTVPPGQTHAQATWRKLTERETVIRKNGRVCDKFIIAIPVEMTQDQAIHTVRRFGNKIAHVWDKDHGRLMRGSYFFTLQDWGTHNPHCHFVFVDADQETGKRVFGTTKNGSTNRLRAAWEATCNGELERLGIEARIDRRPQHVIEAELNSQHEAQNPGKADPIQALRDFEAETARLVRERDEARVGTPEYQPVPTDAPQEVHDAFLNALGATVAGELRLNDPVPPESPVYTVDLDVIRAHEHELVQEDEAMTGNAAGLPDLAEIDQDREDIAQQIGGRIEAGERPVSVVAKVRGAFQLTKRARELHTRREQLRTALHWRTVAEKRSEVAAATASRLTQAERTFEQQHTHGVYNGKAELRGFQAPTWSFLPKGIRGWQSASRKEAVAAQEQLGGLKAEHSANEQNAREAERIAAEQTKHTAQVEKPVEGYEWMNAEQQAEALQEMEQAEQAIAGTRAGTLDGVTAEAIWEAYKAGEIDAEEALAACEAQGFDTCAEAVRHDMAQSQEEGMGQE